MNQEPAIRIRQLDKSYTPGVPVLEGFDFDLDRGKVHSLIGGNGAGKSTLAKILTGLTPKNRGIVTLHGHAFDPPSKQAAAAAGVVMVLQELNIVPTLSVAENLFLHSLPHRFGITAGRQLRAAATTALDRVGLGAVDPDQPARELGVGQQQLVEIAGALAQQSSVLILDEPTAALTDPETERLFGNIRRLKADGVAIIYISHRMEEIARISDCITVLRDGRRIATHTAGSVDTAQLVREMAGNEIASRHAPRPPGDKARQAGLSVRDLHAGDSVRGVSFEARRGEILGIAGLVGAGRTETLRAIFGAQPITRGTILLGPQKAPFGPRSPREAVRAGFAMIPEDRKQDGLLLSKSIRDNVTLATTPSHSIAGVLQDSAEEAAATAACDQLSVVRRSLQQTAAELSGGNQQKIVIARWLLRDSAVFLFDEPTRGIDVAAKETIYQILDRLATNHKTIIVVSSDLDELMRISHRIIVMSLGRVSAEFTPDSWSRKDITAAAFEGYTETRPSA